MARLQIYTSNDVFNRIVNIVNQQKNEGANETEISLSSVGTMLLELGLRVYEAQQNNEDNSFNQEAFNKVVLESLIKTKKAVSLILGMQSFSPYLEGKENYEYHKMVNEIRDAAKEEIKKFFPDD
ncbi:conjugal transfer relaxosome DNA-binding protein TraM (plasmid) [Arsenophonus nasoniae]|uniref:Relaxosome protein TraM n=1 Tax=Arsenophonus nasoniae TaxID=638 RepID=D2U4M8_9GAMM|nr:conjugal transfer relaxosome DNA-binding protein TraM [Arsenophonus nasoniae]QBY45701.1 Relaxosome protein TraM [Arsenophonus nasoniae]WGM07957.1 conjugal transfer relaxosome DNA-binding protein TraM [Arsenophonus nasoniae]WGM12896.1 conjugal transfer relaxosome DNA-binding protein TraM [Arsenophonus nasoniae]WGM17601.1 conjugal transfer relaxosome DNA-binding protein TraM [Arsenophonus nasoniae]CBA76589.1 conjugal transfer protein [Arsenophonus nasoniae]